MCPAAPAKRDLQALAERKARQHGIRIVGQHRQLREQLAGTCLNARPALAVEIEGQRAGVAGSGDADQRTRPRPFSEKAFGRTLARQPDRRGGAAEAVVAGEQLRIHQPVNQPRRGVFRPGQPPCVEPQTRGRFLDAKVAHSQSGPVVLKPDPSFEMPWRSSDGLRCRSAAPVRR